MQQIQSIKEEKKQTSKYVCDNCNNFQMVRQNNSIICGNCGMIIEESIEFENKMPNIYDNKKCNVYYEIPKYINNKQIYTAKITINTNKPLVNQSKYMKLKTINNNIVNMETYVHRKKEELFNIIDSIVDYLHLSTYTKKEAIKILTQYLKEYESEYKNDDITIIYKNKKRISSNFLVLSIASIFLGSRNYDPSLTLKTCHDIYFKMINDKKMSIDLFYVGENKRNVLLNEKEYNTLLDSINNDNEFTKNKNKFKRERKVQRSLSRKIYELSKYKSEINDYSIISEQLQKYGNKIQFLNSTCSVLLSDYEIIKNISKKIYEYTKQYSASPTSKLLTSLYLALLLWYDAIPIPFDPLIQNQIIKQLQKYLKINIINKQTKELILTKYNIYKFNIKRTYIILDPKIIQQILPIPTENMIKINPKIFISEFGNTYYYNEKNDTFCFTYGLNNGEKKTVDISKNEFISIVKSIYANKCLFSSDKEKGVYSFLSDGNIISKKENVISFNYALNKINTVITFYFSLPNKIQIFSDNEQQEYCDNKEKNNIQCENQETNFMLLGTYKIDIDRIIIFKIVKNKKKVILMSLAKNQSQRKYIDFSYFEAICKHIANNQTTKEKLLTFLLPSMVSYFTDFLLTCNILTKKNENTYCCTLSFEEIKKQLKQILYKELKKI